MCDPRICQDFWQRWKEFEIRHGNEDTMREMLRIKRSVQATFNTQINMMVAQIPASNETIGKTAMQALEAKATESNYKQTLATTSVGANIMFVRGEVVGGDRQKKSEDGNVYNPDEIDLDDASDENDDNDEDNEEKSVSENSKKITANIPIEKKLIPSKVFGGLKRKNDSDSE